MASVVSVGIADRIAARTFIKVLRAGSGTRARYSSTFFGATLPFAAESRSPEFAFLIRVITLSRSVLMTHAPFLLTFDRRCLIFMLMDNRTAPRSEVPYGPLDRMVLKTLDSMG